MNALEIDQCDRDIAFGNQLGLETATRSEPVDIYLTRFELARHRQSGEDVATGTTARDHHPRSHALTSRDRLRRIPIETSVTSISVLP